MKSFDLSNLRFDEHPGGPKHLDTARGHARADLLFLSYHLGLNLAAVDGAARARGLSPPEAARSPLFTELSAAAARVRRERARHVLAYRAYCLFVTVALPVALVAYALTLSVASCVAVGFLLVTYAFNIFHVRHHLGGRLYSAGARGTSKRVRARRALDAVTAPLYRFFDETFMMTPEHWIRQHQASHHVFTNDAERDYDVSKPHPLLRLHPGQEWRWFHGFQHFYAPILFALNGFTLAFENCFLKGGRAVYLVAHLGLLIAAPACFHGWSAAFLAYLFTFGLASLVTTYCFQVSHNARSTMRSDLAQRDVDVSYEEWIRQQVEETVSYGGYLTTLLVGGINLQTEHHVGPALEPTLLHFYRSDLRDACEAHGIRYRELAGPLSALAEYHSRLTEMARRPRPTTEPLGIAEAAEPLPRP